MGCSGKLRKLLRAWTLPCRAGLPSWAGMLVPVYFVTACAGSWAEGGMGRVQSCSLHQLQGQLWVSGAGFWVRLLSFLVLTPVN